MFRQHRWEPLNAARSEPLREADEEPVFWCRAAEADIDAGISLQVAMHRPGGGEIEAVLVRACRRMLIDVRPQLDIDRDILHEPMARKPSSHEYGGSKV